MARTDQQITTEALRELTYQSPGFWSRMFRRGISSMMPDFTPRQPPLFDRIVGRIGSANTRSVSEYAKAANLDVNFNQKAADHFLRTMLQGAEALGASADELAAIDWEHLDFADLMTGNPNEWFDLTKIPGLDDKLTKIFGRLGKGFDSTFMEQLGRTFPEHKNEKIQSGTGTAEQQKRKESELDALFERLNKGLDLVNLNSLKASADQKPGEFFFERLAELSGGNDFRNFFNRDIIPDEDGDLVWNPTEAKDKIDAFINSVFGKQSSSQAISKLQSVIRRTAPVANRAAASIFNLLPSFIQRPILQAAGRGGAMAAQAAGQGPQAQAAAAAAAMGAARLATVFKIARVGAGILVDTIKTVVEALKGLAKYGAETVDRVSSYSGALAFAQANFERNETMRNIRMARDIEDVGEELINARDRLAEAMHPADEAAARIGARGSAIWDNLQAGGLESFNSAAETVGEIPLIGDALEAFSLTATKYLNEWFPQSMVMVGIIKSIGVKVGLIEENTQPGKIAPINALGAPGDPMREWFDAMLPGGRRVPPVQPPQAANNILPGVNAIANAINAFNR